MSPTNLYSKYNSAKTLNLKEAAPDTTAPVPVSSNLSNHQQQVAVNANISITFDEPIKAGYRVFIISNGLGDIRRIGTLGAEIKGNTITLNPEADLLANNQYFVQMEAGAVTDNAGNKVAAVMDTSALTFTTAVDKTAPLPLSVTPSNHAEQVQVSSDIVATFNERIMAGNGNIIISNGQGDTRTIAAGDVSQVSFSKGHAGTQININPSKNLLSGSQYYVLVDNDAITDLAGNAFAGTQDNTAFTFKTFSDTTAPLLKENTSPALVGVVTLQFNEAIKAGAGAIVIADSQGNKRSIAIHDTTQVAISTFFATEATVTITPKEGLVAGAQYYVQMDSGVLTDLAGNAFAGIQGTAQSFTTAIPTPPIPINSTPADEQGQVALASDITIKFNEAVKLGAGHFIISNGQGDTRTIVGNDSSQVHYAYNSNSKLTDTTTVIINPKQDLLAGSQYFVQMESGAVTDYEGAPVASVMDTTALNFTTVAVDVTAPIALSSTPGNNAQQVPTNGTITAQFNEPIKAGTGTFILSNGQGDTRTIAANDYPQISVYSNNIIIHPTQFLQADSPYSLQVDNAAITDLQGNAFAGGILNFVTAPAPVDTTAPSLYFNQDTQLISADIKLQFNEAIKLGVGTLVLSNGLGDTRTIAIDDHSQVSIKDSVTLVIHPTQPLLANAQYSIQIDGGTVTDLAGNSFAGIQDTTNAQFYTIADTTAPTIQAPSYSYTRPRQLVNEDISLGFDEQIKAGAGKITVSDGQGDTRIIDIKDSTQIKLEGPTLTINPSQDLHSNSHYSVQLDAGIVTDLSGNAFAGINNIEAIAFDTAGKKPDAAANHPVQEINHGGTQGAYDNKDVLIFNFDTAVTWQGGFNLPQHSFGGHDVVLSADGLSASVELDAASTVTTGDVLYLTGLSDGFGNTGDVMFTL
ncbi:MAG: Ig-like domain-containing protein [Methylococcaceae bacterium]|nr:Ig-like domain-containing protein [Methylococcaceae bacterium]